jgi:ubiquinone/menaquinone biosynthesis C-methylase UbiE
MSRFLKSTVLRMVHRAIRPFIKPDRIIQNPYIAGKIFPMQEEGEYFIVEKPNVVAGRSSDEDSRVPPPELRLGYGNTPEEYLASGRRDVESMLAILAQAGENSETLSRVLELGCATGRMLRFYPHHQNQSEIWGVDIMSNHISWCQQNLSPRIQFATTTTAPHLPFEDNYFDLVYCGSVFTHVSDLADAWFLELRRILRKGGYMYITIHDQNSIKVLLEEYQDKSYLVPMIREIDAKTSVLSKNYESFSINSDPYSQVFYDAQYLIDKWSSFAEFVSKTESAYGYQTALLFRKSL